MPSTPSLRTGERDRLVLARRNLDRFVLTQAEQARREHGIDYVSSPNAASTYPDLLAKYAESVRTGEPFQVSAEHCDSIIYTSATSNHRFRFVHDLEHVTRALTFSTEDELELANYHLEALEVAGYRPDSVEYQLLEADTAGQNTCQAVLGRFPYNQLRFALDAFNYGVDTAVERESQRLPQRQSCTR